MTVQKQPTPKPLVAGSNPAAATSNKPDLSSLLAQIDQLSQEDRDKLFSFAHLQKASTPDLVWVERGARMCFLLS